MRTPPVIPNPIDMWSEEQILWKRGLGWIAGVEEAGRGPLAGPVVAAAVMAKSRVDLDGVNDSKLLTAKQRDRIYQCIREHPDLYVGVGHADPLEIDRINILQASLLAFRRAIEQLPSPPSFCLLDGNQTLSHFEIRQKALVKGDQKSFLIAAASIVAKVERDCYMRQCHERWPEYGFDQHKGYPTRLHREAINQFGICKVHRRSYGPVRQVLTRVPE
jgi:ribonuclease HII